MATLNLSVTQKENFEFVFNVQSIDLDQPSVIVYASISGAEWTHLFSITLNSAGEGSQNWVLGSHLVGEQITFWAGLPGVIASNQVTLTVQGEGQSPGLTLGPCICRMARLPKSGQVWLRTNIRAFLPCFAVRAYYGFSKAVFEILK